MSSNDKENHPTDPSTTNETPPLHKIPQTEPNENNDDNNEATAKEEWELKRDEHKAEGDNAFRAKFFSKAIQEYTNAIAFDPEMHILYSNRSAAYLSNGEKSRALADAKKCIALKPDFVKGHSRLASSMLSLGRWNEARGVYRHILDNLDGDNVVAKKGIEDCRERENKAKEMEREILRQLQSKKEDEDKNKQEEMQEAKKEQATKEEDKGKGGTGGGDDHEQAEEEEDDMLNDFFDDVEEVEKSKNQNNTTNYEEVKEEEQRKHENQKENKIQIQLSDLGDTRTQINRILCSNHEWYNLNPYRVLDISHEAPMDLLSRRYKALSLLLHPDKVRASNSKNDLVEKAEQAFEYIRKANNALKDEDKRKHTIDLIVKGRKHGKKDYEVAQSSNSLGGKTLEKYQEIATMKIFAEIEKRRREVERMKRKYEERERQEEDAEEAKAKKERDFDKSFKQEEKVEKRINNWRNFSSKKSKR